MTVPAERVFLDTNVLLAATDENRPSHQSALAVLNEWPAEGTTLYVSGQVLREYLVVASRPTDANGLALPMDAALGNVNAVLGRATVLEETAAVARRLRQLLTSVDCTGKQVHDANVVATILTHGIRTIVTENVEDFARFEDVVALITLDRA